MQAFQVHRANRLAMTLAAVLLLSSCGGSSAAVSSPPSSSSPAAAAAPASQAAQAKTGGDIRVGLGALWPVLDPFVAVTPPRSFMVFSLFSTLTKTVDNNGKIEVLPSVATAWKQTAPNTWQFTLQSGITFPNGEALDANAVATTANFLVDPANKEAFASSIPIKSASAVSSSVVQFQTASPVADLPNYVSAMALLPAKALTEQGAKFFDKPIGTGPWQVSQWVPAQKLVLTPNPHAFGAKPKAASLTFELVADASSRQAALQTGTMDVINAVPTDQISPLKSAGFNVVSASSPTYIIDIFKKTGPLANPQVRQALNYAVDKESLVKNIMGGTGAVAAGQLPAPGTIGYCPSVPAYPYDQAKAKQLLQAAGVPANTSLTFQTSNGFIVNDTLMAQAVAQMLQQVGFTVNVQPMEFTAYLNVYHGKAPQSELFSWRNSESPFLNGLEQYDFYLSSQKSHDIGYRNSAFDQAFEKAEAAPLGSSDAQAAYCSMATILHNDAPVIFGIAPPDVWAVSKSVTGFSDDLTNVPPFANLAR